MKGSSGDSSRSPETPGNPTIGLSFEQAILLVLERSNQEIKESMAQIMQMMQNWNINPHQRNQPQQRRIERILVMSMTIPA